MGSVPSGPLAVSAAAGSQVEAPPSPPSPPPQPPLSSLPPQSPMEHDAEGQANREDEWMWEEEQQEKIANGTVFEYMYWEPWERASGGSRTSESLKVRRVPEFSGLAGLRSACGVWAHTTAVTVQGDVLTTCDEGLTAACLPWPAAAACCRAVPGGFRATAVRRGGGEVCTWDVHSDRYAEEVVGLPDGDLVADLEASSHASLARTAAGALYWFAERGLAPTSVSAARIATPRRLRRIACSMHEALAETEDDQLIRFSLSPPARRSVPEFRDYPLPAAVTFPLRHMAVAGCILILADALGAVFKLGSMLPAVRATLPAGGHAVRVAAAGFWEHCPTFVALTECGELWDVSEAGPCRSISAHGRLPRGLLPFGGPSANRVLLFPDPSCGKPRLTLVCRIAVRLRLPSDVLRVELLRYAVQSFYIVGPLDDPFCPPSPKVAGSAAAAVQR
eukprot:TRINITY_DN1795_c0_g3_i1.p1 TRINITY_DN1795_c0_g3~~TRINITY_DN1795_c0_g3_i1.p1  ORF type:complete len:448 (+),score=83.20 TRINITY_DN1795_c0_g3_i1:165-1508(+)